MFRGRPPGGMLGIPHHHKYESGVFVESDQYFINISDVQILWYTQRLDHFSPPDTRTWQQRYNVYDKFFDPSSGGPVFLMLGGEGPANPDWFNGTQGVLWAERAHALCIQLEHRYYGESHPTDNVTVENLRWLNSKQALADAAAFISFISNQYNLASNTKWVVFGGSYSGSLAAWLRLKYPHLIDIAVSSSAPLLSILDFSAYLDVVTDSLNSVSKDCTNQIKQATDELERRIQQGDSTELSYLNYLFLLCTNLDPNNQDDVATLFQNLAGNFEDVVQYNRDNRLSSGRRFTMDELCEMMTNDTWGYTPLERYASVNNVLLRGGLSAGAFAAGTQQCTDYSYAKLVGGLRATDWTAEQVAGGMRQWTYQTCTEFAFFQSSASTRQPFGRYFPLDYFIKQCVDVFGPTFNLSFVSTNVAFSNTDYGALRYREGRILFPNGSIDPWHALGVTNETCCLLPEALPVYITGTAHCADMYPSSPDDSPALREARQIIGQHLDQWLAA